ncbi:hypothetical protein [Planobispora takensis]|uniref:Uncharacterized protein n=1 Tax=Planobispora takensis TaxID=1367882 RepID=A0A8J3WS74_9ACTN|nr:hypothetical protein [Planobispora takensis]GIH98942.1 hypothetical protein Pta02_09510 [Planobispora takensis]
MNFCLSDLVPPLRWSDAAAIPLLRDRPALPDAWWRSLPLARVLAVVPPQELAELLAEIALEHWPAAAVGDVLPALYVLDPEEADEPCTSIALDRAGSWPGLLSLTGHDLRDQPFIQARPVLHALFGAVFAHLAPAPPAAQAPPVHVPAAQSGTAETPLASEFIEAEFIGATPVDAAGVDEVDEAAETAEAGVDEEAAEHVPVASASVSGETAVPVDAEHDGAVAADGEAVTPADTDEEAVTPANADEDLPEPANPDEDLVAPVNAGHRAAVSPDVGVDEPRDLLALVDGVFAGLEDTSWAVAQNRVFSDEPATVEALAKLFAVSPESIGEIEAGLRRRLAGWLGSEEAAPYREHLAEIRTALGKAAPRNRLIGAAGWHTRELRSLDVPAWQFVLATLTDYYVVDGWLVDGDIAELQHRTRDLIGGAERPPTVSRALELVSTLGIHPEVAEEWLENVPQLRILGGGDPAAQRSNGAIPVQASGPPPAPHADPLSAPYAGPISDPYAGHPEDEPAQGPPQNPAWAKAPFRPLKDVALTRRCFRQPDGRWWLRIDVTAEHLEGAECPLPSGFAAYLGMAPGDSRTVGSVVGELVVSWHDRPVLESLSTLLRDAGAKEGSHLFLTLSDEGVLRARHLPAAGTGMEPVVRALRLVGYTAPCETVEHAARVIGTRVGMSGPVSLPELLTRLRERGDRDLQSLLA